MVAEQGILEQLVTTRLECYGAAICTTSELGVHRTSRFERPH